jgi:hypothetical protein
VQWLIHAYKCQLVRRQRSGGSQFDDQEAGGIETLSQKHPTPKQTDRGPHGVEVLPSNSEALSSNCGTAKRELRSIFKYGKHFKILQVEYSKILKKKNIKNSFKFSFFLSFFLMGLGFLLRTSHLQSRRSTT